MEYKYLLNWIERTKQRMVDAMGGCCQCCGYDRCNSAFDFHHINPEEKEFSISTWKHKSWAKIIKELKKCILVCSNCHRELHKGTRQLPKNYARFDESYETYNKFLGMPKKQIKCKRCKKTFKVRENSKAKYCNISCANKHKGKVNWEEVNLKEQLKTKSITHIARNLDISWNAVKKRMVKEGISS